jgi:hypothetical protein
MSSKVLIIIGTGEKQKALTGLMYARNAMKRRWLEDVKIVFFGPSEQLIIDDEQVSREVKEIVTMGVTFACKTISDKKSSSDKIEKLGVKVEYIGRYISELIKDGYVPMVW